MYTAYATNTDCPIGLFAVLADAQVYARDWAHRHRQTTVTVKDSGGSVAYTAPVRAKVGSQGT